MPVNIHHQAEPRLLYTGRVVQRKEHPRNAIGARPALAQDFWFCSPPLSWRGKADTQVFRAIRPAFHKGADGTETRHCFLVAQLMGKTRERGNINLFFVKIGLWTLPTGIHTQFIFSRSLTQTRL